MLLLTNLALLFSSTPLEGPEQMALDDLLLTKHSSPLLRSYCWKNPWVTFGYFQEYNRVKSLFPRHQLVRRSSGGGSLDHDGDWTFSLLLPSQERTSMLSPLHFYQQLHSMIVKILHDWNIPASLLTEQHVRRGDACFLSPALYDIMLGDKKIVGGAQRRHAGSLLYQGSLRLPHEYQRPLVDDSSWRQKFFLSLAACLSTKVTLEQEDPRLLKEAEELASRRYRTIAWREKR